MIWDNESRILRSGVTTTPASIPGSIRREGRTLKNAVNGRRAYTLDVMKIRVDSVEYKCWHEVGHATACLHLGGDVDSIELLDGDARGHAVARCVVLPEIEKSVACGGFAAEFYLLNYRHAEQGPEDDRNISDVVFHNATHDREDFWGRRLGRDEAFTKAEDQQFMDHAIGFVVPILERYFPGMQELARELFSARRVEGRRVKELLRIGITRAAS